LPRRLIERPQSALPGTTALETAGGDGSWLGAAVGLPSRFSHETKAQDGEVALFLALQASDDVMVIRFVLSVWPASIRARDGNGRTFLKNAVENGLSDGVVECLMYWWHQAARERDDQGCLPIHFRYVQSFTETWPNRNIASWPGTAQLLFMLCPESLQLVNNDGAIPLHGAAQFNSLPLVQFFVEAFPDGVRHRSKSGWLPLHIAVESAQSDGVLVVPYLLQQWP
jgi:hypothetical protein